MTEALGDPENLLLLPRYGILGFKIFFLLLIIPWRCAVKVSNPNPFKCTFGLTCILRMILIYEEMKASLNPYKYVVSLNMCSLLSLIYIHYFLQNYAHHKVAEWLR